jgi:hypothetical protein
LFELNQEHTASTKWNGAETATTAETPAEAEAIVPTLVADTTETATQAALQ